MPSLVLGGLLVVGGLYFISTKAPKNDFDGAFEQIEELTAQEHFDEAAHLLHSTIEPHLHLASPEQTARFHAIVADWIFFAQRAKAVSDEDNNKQIVLHYSKAAELGLDLKAERLEHWAETLISLGELEQARTKLAELEALAESSAGDEERLAMQRRNNVMRRLVEFGLNQPDLSYDTMMQMLGEYRADPKLSAQDDAWAVARQAELRFETDQAAQAVERLLVDMRRVEMRVHAGEKVRFGELYGLLGRGYWELGEISEAKFYLERALSDFEGPEPARGLALVLLGQIAVAEGQLEEAFENFDQVVRDFTNTKAYLPGLLGRAEVRSILGDHQHSLDDYQELRQALTGGEARRELSAQRLGRSLADRHDAAMAGGKLELALKYILIGEQCFRTAEVPTDVLARIASTSRQIADDLIAGARSSDEAQPLAPREVDPGVRHEANTNYKRAGEYYFKHSRAVAGLPGEDNTWADSLWLAADSFDRGGWYDSAISHFKEYLSSSASADSRRPEAAFRLAQAHQAQRDYAPAAQYYEQVIADQPNSPFAAASHVPLARCYVALDRRTEAEQQLAGVLQGLWTIGPEAADYREAQIELGCLFYDSKQYVRAIEELDKAVSAYSDHPRIDELRYRLADSHLKNAYVIKDKLSEPALSRPDVQRLESQRSEHLQTSLDAFGKVIEAYETKGARPLDKSQQDLLRYAYLSRADSAYLLGELDSRMYESAVALYDQAARKYSNNVAAMTALVQIVNCYYAMNDPERARVAQHRAQVRLDQLPDEAFSAPDAVLDRQAWQMWLRNSPLQVQGAAQASAANPPGSQSP